MRELVSFKPLNLIGPWPMKGPFDAVFCRNVAIYFDKPTQGEVVRPARARCWRRTASSISAIRKISAPGGDGFRLVGKTIYQSQAPAARQGTQHEHQGSGRRRFRADPRSADPHAGHATATSTWWAPPHDPIDARDKIKTLNPDVVTLDIEMPNMNGLAFLDKLMRLRPMPVVMVSTLTTKGASETLLALELGAVDFVAKPSADLAGGLDAFGANLRDKVRAAAKSRCARPAPCAAGRRPTCRSDRGRAAGALIAIGASTGGVEAIRAVLSHMPTDCPPIVIAQHMPPGFTTRFAARLDELCELTVVEAEDRMPLLPGHAYVARGRLSPAGRAHLGPAQVPA